MFRNLLPQNSKKRNSNLDGKDQVQGRAGTSLADSVLNQGKNETSYEEVTEDKEISSSHEIGEMQQEAVDLCEILNTASKAFETKKAADIWIGKLEKCQRNESFRMSYFCITEYIFGHEVEERSGFLTNLVSVVELAQKKYKEDPINQLRLYKMALKFQDHVNLAIQQKHLVKKTHDEMLKEAEGLVIPKVDQVTKEMTSQLVGMVALFTALSFIVFGGISALDSIMKALQETSANTSSVLPTLIVAIGWAFCMLNLLFAFMYFVIRITRLPKPVDEDAKNVVQRYPVVFLANYILLVLFLIFGAFWFAECNGIGRSIFVLAISNERKTFFIGLAIIFIVLLIIGWRLWRSFKPKNK